MPVAVGIIVLFDPLPSGGFLALVPLPDVVALVRRLGSGHTFGCAAASAAPTVSRGCHYVFQGLELVAPVRHFLIVAGAATSRSGLSDVDNSSDGSVASTS
ncbi:hypothetical protein [Embleya hyalina]|uniref:Uncharacterized protein n=1 Tax=Embleya hyalina TaxID=516124 RepID=A0A401YGP7_9ACTN|nr:hypothetical protein [Embleya hyalina]GCD93782.1 hypothetical protein EHYA_01433 [Embleya hyalina]